jgi:hypothetical protein
VILIGPFTEAVLDRRSGDASIQGDPGARLCDRFHVVGDARRTRPSASNGKPCRPAGQLNKELFIDENGNVGWGGSGRQIDCCV